MHLNHCREELFLRLFFGLKFEMFDWMRKLGFCMMFNMVRGMIGGNGDRIIGDGG